MDIETRILIVEDEPADQMLLLHALQKAGHSERVRIISDGKVAARYLFNESNHAEELVAIFLDLKIPSMSGIELLEKIRADERIGHLPVIIMTAYRTRESVDQCQKLGISCYVEKPVSYLRFTAAIAECFHSKRDTTKLPRLAGVS